MNMHELFKSTPMFADRLAAELHTLNMLDVCNELEMDHICVRLNRVDAVQRLQRELLAIGRNISTAKVNGRDIYLIQLSEPLLVGRWETSCIELPLPKPGTLYSSGWEHVEFVLPTHVNSLPSLQIKFSDTFSHLDSIAFSDKYERKDDQPHVQGGQKQNPTIAIKRAGVSIKFHPLPIQEVVGAV